MSFAIRRGIAAWLLLAAGTLPAIGQDRYPKVISQPAPVFPTKLKKFGDAQIEAEFVVDTQGDVRSVKVVACTCAEVEAPVVRSILQWKFLPEIKNGRLVDARLQVPITFSLGEWYGPDIWPWDIDRKAPAGAPPDFQYDTPPTPKLLLPAIYPRDLLLKGVEGSATIAFAVDPSGRPRHLVAVDASEPEFAAAAVAMMASWRMFPAKKGSVPCWAAVRMTQKFDTNQEDVSSDDHTPALVEALTETPCRIIANPALLDTLPQLRYHPAAEVPEVVARARVPARALIEVVIDKFGNAQAPVIVSATHDAFGWAAATAAGRWQFTVPMKNGKPVYVFARIPFEYLPPATASGR